MSLQSTHHHSNYSITCRTQFGVFGITHHDQVICNVQIQLSPVVIGDGFQLIADFSEVEIPCEQVSK